MGALVERIASKSNFLWLDFDAYAAKLLAKGVAPWLDTAAFVALQGRALGLLKPDVVALDLGRAASAWLEAHAALRNDMAAKTRPGYPLKTLLADEGLRAHLAELAQALRASQAGKPFALVLPSPRSWPALAYAQAHAGERIEIDDDEADSAALHIADFLRAFAHVGADAILLVEAPEFTAKNAADFECYQAVLNVAAGYRWDTGVHLERAADAAATTQFSYVIAQQLGAQSAGVLDFGADFLTAKGKPKARACYAMIPAAAKPESVLARLAALRET